MPDRYNAGPGCNAGLATGGYWISHAMKQGTLSDAPTSAGSARASTEDELNEYLEITSDWLWRTDAAHRFISIRVGKRLSGQFDPAPCIGKTRREMSWADTPPAFWDAHQKQLDAHKPFSFMLPRRALDGCIHYFEVSGQPVFDGAGRFAGYVGFGRDVSDRVRAEQRVIESEERFRDLAALGSDWFWEQDAEFRFIRFGGGDVGKTGADIAKVLGKRRWELDIVDVPEEQWARHRAQLERHEPFSDLEYRIVGDDGKTRWVSVSGKPRFGADGAFLGYRGIGREITALRTAQADLRESERRYRDIAELSSEWFWEQDAELRFTHFSNVVPGASHYDTSKAIGQTRWELQIRGVSEDGWNAHRAACARREPFRDFIYEVCTPAGEWRWFSVSGKPLFADSGEFRGYRGTGRDITAQVHAERVLRESEQKLRLIVENVPAGLAYFGADGRCRFANRHYCDLFGRGDTLHGRHIGEILPAELLARTRPHWDGAYAGEAQHFEHPQAMPDGTAGQVEVWIVPDFESGGSLRGVLAMLTNLTARKHAEDEVRRLNDTLEERVRQRTAELTASNKELEAFSYSVSHDLRAPLRGIEGFAQILAEEYGGMLDDAGKSHLARIRAASMRMAHLIDDLIELGRITRIELRRARIDLGSMAREIHAELSDATLPAAPQLALTGDLFAEGDPQLLRILVENLLRNAVKFSRTAAEPKIEFGAAPGNAGRTYFMRDNGVGFDMQFADKLFQPFQKLHSPAEFSGNGIGLATVLRIAQRHGGTAWAEGRPGGGAIFYFSLGSGN